MKPLNYLEALGWSLLAREVLGIRAGEARMLALLACERPGRIVSCEDLSNCRWSKHEDGRTDASARMAVRMAKVRGALRDVGFPSSTLENIHQRGYRIGPLEAVRIRAFVEGEAA